MELEGTIEGRATAMGQICSANLPARAPAKDRSSFIELFRAISACGVIWFHTETTPCKSVGYAGLVFFLVIAVYFQTIGNSERSLADYLSKRAVRLLLPWGVWSGIYALANLIKAKPLFPVGEGWVSQVLSGPWIGLWYLPFAFLLTVVVHSIKSANGCSARCYGIWLLTSLLFLSASAIIRNTFQVGDPWAQWIHAMPSIPIGLALGVARRCGRAPFHYLLLVLLVLGCCAALSPYDVGLSISYGVGLILVICGLVLPSVDVPAFRTLGQLSMGAYLTHGLVLSGMKLFPPVVHHYVLWFFATTAIAFCAAYVLRRVGLEKLA